LALRTKQQKNTSDGIAKQYVNLDILSGTSVSCERLFSAAKFILTDTRKSMSPSVFESILLLKVNRTEWDALSVGRSMGKTTGMSFGGDSAMKHAVDNDDEVFYEF
jgi:hypothetical protein